MIVFRLALLAALVAAGPALAESRALGGKYSKADIEAACSKVGGSFQSGGAVMYGCINKNCDGKGGDCSVTCDAQSQECVGDTPSRLVGGKVLIGILQDGDNILRAPGGAGGTSLSGPGEGGAPAGPILY